MSILQSQNRPATRIPGAPRPAPPRLRDRLSAVLPALIPGVTLLVIALWGATGPVLSWDEVTSADVARWSGPQIWALIHSVDAVFGPYYFFLHLWTSIFGDSVLMLRLPSIIMMAATAALIGETGRRYFHPLAGITGGLIFALLPSVSRYAAEARPYAFACFFALLAPLLLRRALQRPGVLRWAGYGLSVIALGLSHIVALTTLGAHAVIVLYDLRERRSWRIAAVWTAAVVAALAVLSPLAVAGLGQQHQQVSWITPLTWQVLRGAPADIVGGVPPAWLLCGLALAALFRPSRAVVETALLAVVPLVVVGLVSVLLSPLWVSRYLLIVLAPIALLAGAATVGRMTARPWFTAARMLAVVVLLAVAAYPGQRAVRAPYVKNGSDYRGAAQIIEQGQQPGDGIVYMANSRAQRAGFDYYLRDDPGRPRDLTLQRPAAEVAALVAQEYPDATARLAGVQRVWLFVYGKRTDPTVSRKDLRKVLRADFRRAGVWELSRGTLALYVRR